MITDERGCTENCAASHLGREMEKTRIIIYPQSQNEQAWNNSF